MLVRACSALAAVLAVLALGATPNARAQSGAGLPACDPDTPAAFALDYLGPDPIRAGQATEWAAYGDDFSIGLPSNPVTFDFRKPDGTLIASYTRDLSIPVSLWARLDRLEINVSASAVETYPDGSEPTCLRTVTDSITARREAYFSPGCGTTASKPRRVIVACGDGNFQLRGLRWRRWTRPTAFARGIARINDCMPDCADGAFHRARIAVRPRGCATVAARGSTATRA